MAPRDNNPLTEGCEVKCIQSFLRALSLSLISYMFPVASKVLCYKRTRLWLPVAVFSEVKIFALLLGTALQVPLPSQLVKGVIALCL